ncbi:MAG: hypothetical protein ACOYJI_02670 [Anaerovoracaceae bacterium]|jgi:phage terminase large subunit-like protein
MADRIGRQTPTRSFVLPYKKTSGEEAIQLYERSGRKAMDWQKLLVYDMLARNKTSEWTHMSFGYAVPRQNGKNEIVVIREMYGLLHGERILHTAHRTGTAHAAWERLVTVLTDAKLIDPGLKDKGLYRANEKEHIYLDAYVEGGGRIEFRTRTSKGGLGESYDLLVIDEAQEYQDDQKAALQYTISASENPQTVLCGTPPTVSSVGVASLIVSIIVILRNSTKDETESAREMGELKADIKHILSELQALTEKIDQLEKDRADQDRRFREKITDLDKRVTTLETRIV